MVKKLKNKFILIVISIVLGLAIGIQVRTINRNTSIKTDEATLRSKELALKLKKSIEERDRQKEEIDKLNNRLYEYENSSKNLDDVTRSLYNEIDSLKGLACLTDVTGEGVIIKISPPLAMEDLTGDAIRDNPEFLLKLISVLNSADAEAISINGHRYSTYSAIERAGNHLKINKTAIAMPYIVSAIGDAETLKSAMEIKSGVLDTIKALGLSVNVEKKSDVKIPKLEKIPNISFITKVKKENE